MRGEFNRGSLGRGARTPRGAFQLAAGKGVKLATQAKILRASDQVRAKVEKHHSAHRTEWINKRYANLLSKVGNNPKPKPPLGLISDPKLLLMSKVRHEVAMSRTQRIARVEKAVANMLATGRVRENRRLDWGKGLGE
jgi:hypothetical protein